MSEVQFGFGMHLSSTPEECLLMNEKSEPSKGEWN